ncbi:radical SAM protein [Ferroacidibacillus organovorans]|uniref:Radical SAM core domain-containing protein n=1 Tax=Ferroacidibacillus organovorans TaxID=1765683 RepID=A0A1V4EVI9_9BACL|nr:radical SAM protein [Ferroacidibacillus organovorans]OPG16963.1 hypothetical protein B2M26_03910 [Ferroacidibacillus organovorans]
MELKKLKLEIARRCMLTCTHCSAFATPAARLALPYDRMQQLIYEFADLGGQEITFTGGEPFLYDRLSCLLKSASDLNLETIVFSSGVIRDESGSLTPLSEGFLGRYPVLPDCVVFSLYSSEREGHQRITRQPGSYDMTITSIKTCREMGIEVDLHFVPTKDNINLFGELVGQAKELGSRKIRVLRYVPHGRGGKNADVLQPDFRDLVSLASIVRDLQVDNALEVKMGSAFSVVAPDLTHKCAAAVDEIVIDARGNTYACSAFVNSLPTGNFHNIMEHSLEDVWMKSTALNQVRQVLNARETLHQCESIHAGCIAQKTLIAGRITDSIQDPCQIADVG